MTWRLTLGSVAIAATLVSGPAFAQDDFSAVYVMSDNLGDMGFNDNAIKVAAAEMVRWLALLTGLDPQDAHQLVSQVGKLRVGNLVNPEYTVLLSIPKTNLPKGTVAMGRPVSTGEKI